MEEEEESNFSESRVLDFYSPYSHSQKYYIYIVCDEQMECNNLIDAFLSIVCLFELHTTNTMENVWLHPHFHSITSLLFIRVLLVSVHIGNTTPCDLLFSIELYEHSYTGECNAPVDLN